MMWKTILSMLMVCALWGCHGQSGKSDSATTQAVAHQQSDADEVASRVQEIYATVFKVYNEEDSLRNLDIPMENGVWENRDRFNKDFCSKEWNRLLARVNEIDSLNHEGEMGFWEADYWIMGQDWNNLSISDVEVLTVTQNEAFVQLKLHNMDAVKAVGLPLVKEDGTWRIDNFLVADSEDPEKKVEMNWKLAMQQYIEKETVNSKK